MASAFSLFGELQLDTGAFENSVKDAQSKLVGLQQEVSNTESASAKLGDTLPTVGRRYEKLNEQIGFQRDRLNQAAQAYATGDINAKKYVGTLTSVETQTRGLASRIKDAQARVAELDNTGLSHFQNQIRGAVSEVDNLERRTHGGGLFDLNRSRPILGVGPAFAATGLRQYGLDETVANVLLVAARESGLLKVNAGEAAKATRAVADSAHVFSREAVVAAAAAGQIEVAEVATKTAAESAAVFEAAFATSATEAAAAAAATTASYEILGVSVVAIGAALAAGGIAILAAYEASKNIREEAEKRLKTEEQIEGVINQQYLNYKKYQDALKEGAEQRAFGRYTDEGAVSSLVSTRDRLQKEIADAQKRYADEVGTRKTYADNVFGVGNTTGSQYVAEAANAVGYNADEQARKQKQVIELNAAIDNRTFEERKKSAASLDKAINDLDSNSAAQVKKRAEERDQLIKKAIQQAEEFARKVQAAGKTVEGLLTQFTPRENPIARIFAEGQQAIDKAAESTKYFSKNIQDAVKNLINAKTAQDAFKQNLDNKVQAAGLRYDAESFRKGYRPEDDPAVERRANDRTQARLRELSQRGIGADSQKIYNNFLKEEEGKTIQARLQSVLDVIGGSARGFSSEWLNSKGNAIVNAQDEAQKAIRDRAIIAATNGVDPARLTSDQRDIAAGARNREANRLDNEKKEAQKTQQELVRVLKELDQAVKNGSIVHIVDDSNGRAKVTPGNQASVNARY